MVGGKGMLCAVLVAFLQAENYIRIKRLKKIQTTASWNELCRPHGWDLGDQTRVLQIPADAAEESVLKTQAFWASLVAQWLRICLLMQGTRVRALVWEDPTCHGAAGPVSHNY